MQAAQFNFRRSPTGLLRRFSFDGPMAGFYPKVTNYNPQQDYTASLSYFKRITVLNPKAYNLSHELCDFLISSKGYFLSEFPFLSNQSLVGIYANFGLSHLVLLEDRLDHLRPQTLEQHKVTGTDLLHYWQQGGLFIKLADSLNNQVSAEDFSSHFQEEYTTRLNRLKALKRLDWKNPDSDRILDNLDELVFERKGKTRKDDSIAKMKLYLHAHVGIL